MSPEGTSLGPENILQNVSTEEGTSWQEPDVNTDPGLWRLRVWVSIYFFTSVINTKFKSARARRRRRKVAFAVCSATVEEAQL
jgi:hypothetical protein